MKVKMLTDAIAAAEKAAGELTGADGAQAMALDKYNAALKAKDDADAVDALAVQAFNAALEDLIAAAAAAKRSTGVQVSVAKS